MCASYNPNHQACISCEANKVGGERCRCTPEQLLSYRIISDRLGYEPWEASQSYVNPAPVDVSGYNDWDSLVDGLSQSGKLKLDL